MKLQTSTHILFSSREHAADRTRTHKRYARHFAFRCALCVPALGVARRASNCATGGKSRLRGQLLVSEFWRCWRRSGWCKPHRYVCKWSRGLEHAESAGARSISINQQQKRHQQQQEQERQRSRVNPKVPNAQASNGAFSPRQQQQTDRGQRTHLWGGQRCSRCRRREWE